MILKIVLEIGPNLTRLGEKIMPTLDEFKAAQESELFDQVTALKDQLTPPAPTA